LIGDRSGSFVDELNASAARTLAVSKKRCAWCQTLEMRHRLGGCHSMASSALDLVRILCSQALVESAITLASDVQVRRMDATPARTFVAVCGIRIATLHLPSYAAAARFVSTAAESAAVLLPDATTVLDTNSLSRRSSPSSR
jgi:hypothetical protein